MCDTIIDYFKKNSIDLLNLYLKNKKLNLSKYICNDYIKCKECKYLSKVGKINKEKSNYIEINFGKYKNNHLEIKTHKLEPFKLIENKILCCLILNDYNNFLYSYICNYKIKIIYIKYFTFHEIIKDIKIENLEKLYNNFLHIINILKEKYKFNHSNASIDYLRFDKDYNIFILPSSYSHLEYNNIKFCSEENVYFQIPLQYPIYYCIDQKIDIEKYSEKKIKYYMIGNKYINFLKYIRSNDFDKSFDICIFTLSMISNKDFLIKFKKTKYYNEFIKNFLIYDFENEIIDNNFDYIYKIIKNKKILYSIQK